MRVLDAQSLSTEDFNQILSFLRSGGVIAFPTDTAYGLAVDPFNASAVQRIFAIKGRPETKPILLVVNSVAMLQQVAFLPELGHDLAKRFWPGPLTLVLPALKTLPEIVTAGTGRIGIRWPDAPFATRLIAGFGKPLTATSANRSGMPAALTAEEVRFQLEQGLDMLIDGGALTEPGGSTVLDVTRDPPLLLREGPVSWSALSEFLQGNIRRQNGKQP